jgi:ribosomal protein S18 acetylase RimI-like enzyme
MRAESPGVGDSIAWSAPLWKSLIPGPGPVHWMAAQMNIRPYCENDWPRLCEIHDAARRDELSSSALSDAFLTLEQTALDEGLFDATMVVAELDGIVSGFAAHTASELTWLYCHPASYRQGVGRALLRHVIGACDGTLFTEVLVGNDAALRLYLSEGFEVIEKKEGKLAGNETFAASAYYLGRSSN